MEEEKIGEQLDAVQPSLEENQSGSPQAENEEVAITSEAERGVPIGKFKSVEDLFDAYNNLEAEFTRKSQKLAELEKDKTQENAQEERQAALGVFLSKNQEAFAYADEIRARMDESPKKEEDIEKIWAGMLYEKLSTPNRTKEPLFQNLILKDDEVQKAVIENYLKNLSDRPPVVISSNSGEKVTKTTIKKPDTFEEAKRVVLDLLD